MAFILRVGSGKSAEPLSATQSSSEATLLQLCSEGRKLYEYAAPGVRLVVDQVPHDCRLIQRLEPGKQDVVAVCFGWCNLMGREGARFDDEVLDAVLAGLRADPLRPARAGLRLTGNFVLVVIDRELNRVFVLNDEWGIRCFYYGRNKQDVVVSSRAAAAACLLRSQIDGMAWIAGLRGSMPTENGTMFHAVCRSLPGQAIVADLASGGVMIPASELLYDRHIQRPFMESAAVLCKAVRSSVRRCMSFSPLVDLTGGHDTRMVAAAISADGIADSTFFHVGIDRGNADGPIALEIAARLGARITSRHRDAEEDPHLDFFSKCSVLFDGYFVSLGDVRRMWAASHEYKDFKFHLGSLGGELARDFFWRHEYTRWWTSQKVDLSYLLSRRMYAHWDDSLLKASGIVFAKLEHDEYLLAPLHAKVRRLEGVSKWYVLDILYLGRVAQQMSKTWAYAPTETVMAPFLSKEFLDATLSACWWQRVGRRLQLDVLHRLDPGLCNVPNDAGMTMSPLTIFTLGSHIRSLCNDVIHRLPGRRHQPSVAPQRSIRADIVLRGNELDRSGCFPDEVSRLFRWLLHEGTDRARLELLVPAVVGFGELLSTYRGIKRNLCFDRKPIYFPDAEELMLAHRIRAAGRNEGCHSGREVRVVNQADKIR
jgi:hypothetical protein